MAGECPHSTFLETTLKQWHQEAPSLDPGNHESYLKIIGDLKHDLEAISCEVVMVQKEYSDHHQGHETENVGFENSLKELETQNDRLQQALQLQTQVKDAALTDLQTNNETLKCQIGRFRCKLFEKDQQIAQLSSMLSHISQLKTTEPKQVAVEYDTTFNNFTADLEKKITTLSEKLDQSRRQEQLLHSETRKLTEELSESRRKNRDLISQAHRLAGLLKCQESVRKELAAKYETLEQNYENQAKKLSAANKQLCMLDDKFQNMEVRQSEHNMECNLLREEVLSLKEKLAGAMGCQKSMQDQLIKTEKELYNAHEVIREQKNILQRNECTQIEEKRRWQAANLQLKEKLTDLAKQHKILQEEHEVQKELNTRQLELLESLRKWKDQQLKSDKNARDELKNYQVIIRNLLEEKQKLLATVYDTSKEYSLLQNELDILKLCPSNLPHCNSVLNASERSITKLFELVHRAKHRLSEQNSLFKDEESIASRDISGTAYRPSEEPN